MLNAFKRLTGKGDTSPLPPGSSTPNRTGHQSMSYNLQRKFARGVQYNMKIIIKGDRNVGKTALFHRLKGEKFVEEYTPTDEIQVACIQWNYKATDDVVKVEVWDVVDKGKKKKQSSGLKLDNANPTAADDQPEEPVLDAEFLDVYKGTNGVILVLDITKNWTFEYVQRELPKVPLHIPVLVLANHCDMAHHRVVTADHVIYFIEGQQRPDGFAQIRYAESSMRNGFGLKFLHKFLNVPFLQLQRETLLAQLETNAKEITSTMNELDLFLSSPEADYNRFLENLVNKRRQVADSTSGAFTPSVSSGISQSASSPQLTTVNSPVTDGRTPNSEILGTGQPIGRGQPIGGGQPIPVRGGLQSKPVETLAPVLVTESRVLVQSAAPEDISNIEGKKQPSFMSKIFGKKDTVNVGESRQTTGIANDKTEKPVSVEEFVPDGGLLDRSFLDDANAAQSNPHNDDRQPQDSDSDFESSGNPLVRGFQDDIDSDEDLCKPLKGVTVAQVEHDQIDDDEDDNDEVPAVAKSQKSESLVVKKNTEDSSSSISSLEVQLPSELNQSLLSENSSSVQGSLDGEVCTITASALDAWLGADSKIRRSPEGGEDIIGSRESTASQSSRYFMTENPESDNENEKGERASKKEKRREKKEDKSSSVRKHKKKSKDKEKDRDVEKEKKRKKPSQKRTQDDLEEFLNGSSSTPNESAYEAL